MLLSLCIHTVTRQIRLARMAEPFLIGTVSIKTIGSMILFEFKHQNLFAMKRMIVRSCSVEKQSLPKPNELN